MTLRIAPAAALIAAALGCRGTISSNPPRVGAPARGAPAWSGGALPDSVTLSPRPLLVSVGGVDVYQGGYGSALALHRDGRQFWLLTDRGPNYDAAADVKAFPLPRYAPLLGRFAFTNGRLELREAIPLRRPDGTALTGIPNPAGAGGTGESATDVAGTPIALDSFGVDTEGLVALAGGSFWIADEYGPTLMHFDPRGRMLRRLTPFGGACALPAVLAKRRSNRGIEGLAGDPSGTTLVASLEMPLDNPRAAGRASRVIRLLRLDTRTCATQQFSYVLEAAGNVISDIAWLGPDELLVIENDRKLPGHATDPSTVKRVYRISLAAATDVSDAANGATGRLFNGRTLEEVPFAELGAAGIVPASKSLVADLLPSGYPHDKSEGLAILDASTLAISNDDDFGVTDTGQGGWPRRSSPAPARWMPGRCGSYGWRGHCGEGRMPG